MPDDICSVDVSTHATADIAASQFCQRPPSGGLISAFKMMMGIIDAATLQKSIPSPPPYFPRTIFGRRYLPGIDPSIIRLRFDAPTYRRIDTSRRHSLLFQLDWRGAAECRASLT